jgi:hypothetical protein
METKPVKYEAPQVLATVESSEVFAEAFACRGSHSSYTS